MIKVDVKNISVDDFINTLKTYKFGTIQLWEQYIRDFFKFYDKQQCENTLLEEKERQKKILKLKEEEFEELYQDVMLLIDDRMMERAEYFERIAKKNKYRGRYKYPKKNGNTKRKT